MNPPFDPRSLANFIIRLGEEYHLDVTQISLQKVCYFINGRYYLDNGIQLVSGYFETWRYGPVHPLIYNEFKKYGNKSILHKASIRNLKTGESKEAPEPDDPYLRRFITRATLELLPLGSTRLVNLSHAKNSPWDILTRAGGDERKFGMRITEEVYTTHFRNQLASVSDTSSSGEEYVETPPP